MNLGSRLSSTSIKLRTYTITGLSLMLVLHSICFVNSILGQLVGYTCFESCNWQKVGVMFLKDEKFLLEVLITRRPMKYNKSGTVNGILSLRIVFFAIC